MKALGKSANENPVSHPNAIHNAMMVLANIKSDQSDREQQQRSPRVSGGSCGSSCQYHAYRIGRHPLSRAVVEEGLPGEQWPT